jgi:hypothetical protein
LYNGDSATVIETLDLPKEPIIFYLDAHYSGGKTAGSDIDNGCPLLRELNVICKRQNNSDIIFVDDIRLLGKAEWSGIEGHEVYPLTFFDFTHVTLESVINTIKKYYDDPKFYMSKNVDRLIILF